MLESWRWALLLCDAEEEVGFEGRGRIRIGSALDQSSTSWLEARFLTGAPSSSTCPHVALKMQDETRSSCDAHASGLLHMHAAKHARASSAEPEKTDEDGSSRKAKSARKQPHRQHHRQQQQRHKLQQQQEEEQARGLDGQHSARQEAKDVSPGVGAGPTHSAHEPEAEGGTAAEEPGSASRRSGTGRVRVASLALRQAAAEHAELQQEQQLWQQHPKQRDKAEPFAGA